MNIVLIGMRGSGKTTVGKLLARHLKKDFIAMDELVAKKAGMEIAQIVKKYGWEYFRDLESKITQAVSQKDNVVIAAGGGVVVRPENVRALKQHGKLFLLTVGVDTLLKRIGTDANRPSLTGKSQREDMEETQKQRQKLYETAADVVIDTEKVTPKEVMEEIIKTKSCCIIGNPVEHSLSPIMHNAGYKALGLNFVFVAFRVSDVKRAIEGLRALNVRGIVVTVPHKLEVMKYVDEIDETARAIGAVNTIVNNDGKLLATNTDWTGGIGPLKQALATQGETLRGKRVALLGAGGGARALAFGLKKEGAKVTIFNRTIAHAKQIMKELGLEEAFGLEAKNRIRATDIIVNATSLGMEPNVDSCAIDADCIKPNHIVYDIVYTPRETKLLKMAKSKNATIVYGDKMVLYGGIPQFELFTGVKAPVAVMEEALLKGLTKHE